jgi:hypothetical protein
VSAHRNVFTVQHTYKRKHRGRTMTDANMKIVSVCKCSTSASNHLDSSVSAAFEHRNALDHACIGP